MKYAKHERVWLAGNAEFDERWVHDRIAEDPSILGLGELVLKDRERAQPRAGVLDLLLQEKDGDCRFAVEVQLGKTDESHIIRTIEYWDIEQKRFPSTDHFAVIVAEDITSRFLNVISLFNGHIPLIAIQMQAIRVGDSVSLVFTKVLDHVMLGDHEEDEGPAEVVDRGYWEGKSGKRTIEIVDSLLGHLRKKDPELSLRFIKRSIGVTKRGKSNNFVKFYPRNGWLWLGLGIIKSVETDAIIRSAGLPEDEWEDTHDSYWVKVTVDSMAENVEALESLLDKAYTQAQP